MKYLPQVATYYAKMYEDKFSLHRESLTGSWVEVHRAMRASDDLFESVAMLSALSIITDLRRDGWSDEALYNHVSTEAFRAVTSRSTYASASATLMAKYDAFAWNTLLGELFEKEGPE